jgi:hypothetical protein
MVLQITQRVQDLGLKIEGLIYCLVGGILSEHLGRGESEGRVEGLGEFSDPLLEFGPGGVVATEEVILVLGVGE